MKDIKKTPVGSRILEPFSLDERATLQKFRESKPEATSQDIWRQLQTIANDRGKKKELSLALDWSLYM